MDCGSNYTHIMQDTCEKPQKRCRKYDDIDMTRLVRRKVHSYNIIPKNPFELKFIHDNPNITIKPSKKILKDIAHIYHNKQTLIKNNYIIIGKYFNNLKFIENESYELSDIEFAIRSLNEASFFSTHNIYNYLIDNKIIENIPRTLEKPLSLTKLYNIIVS